MFLHGMGGSAEGTWREPGWLDLAAEEGHEVTAIDFLGHGDADKPTDPDAYAKMAAPLHQLLDHGSCIGVGFSLGARVLLEVARQRPHDFERLALLGVGDNLFDPWDPQVLIDALEGRPTIDHPFVNHLVDLVNTHADPAALAAMLRYRGNDSIQPEDLAGVSCPVLVVLGDSDPVGPADTLMNALPNAQLVTLPRCDHFATTNKFDAIDAVLRFLG